MIHDPTQLPAGLPVPTDDGAAEHLRGMAVPDIVLEISDQGGASQASLKDVLREAGRAVLFFYPRTGVPGQPPSLGFAGEEWESIAGARGCTPQACGFRDLHASFVGHGVAVFGVATNTAEHQREFAQRTGAKFRFVSDAALALTRALNLPTFEFPVESGGPSTLLRRTAWFVENDSRGTPRIRRVWYPVFPPDRNAADVLAWVERRTTASVRMSREGDRGFIVEMATELFGGPEIWSMGKPYDTLALPTLIAEVGGVARGMLCLAQHRDSVEVVALAAKDQFGGIGSLLMDAAEDWARDQGLNRLVLTTSNDNLDAMRFYQRRGMRMTRVYPGLIDEYRKKVPSIPRIGHYGIPIRDDVLMEVELSP